jgi:hypothetical protein
MSALEHIPDQARTSRHVRFVPKPEVAASFDHFVGAFFLAQAFRLYKQETREVLV